ncbi:sigma-70 family RNA polymerase sigma factor [bacterium]|nr:MAG: sigma-70 family RNA polymerase sigma factor [bacterium]
MKLFQHTKINYNDLDDHQLVQMYQQKGDELAFNQILSRYQDKVYSYIYSMVTNPDVAADIFQETFTKVVAKLDETYNEQGKFIAWVMRIAHNATIDHIRKHRRFVDVNAHVDENDGTDFYERLPDEGIISADDQMANDQTKTSLLKHIANLPEEQKQVVLMRHYYDMSFKEIADITGVSINTALGRMRYALINLRKMFDKEQQGDMKYASR